MSDVLLGVKNVTKAYISGYLVKAGLFEAVKKVSFDVKKEEIVSLVGESGSGKTTVARMILRLVKPTKGHIMFHGKDIFSLNKVEYWKNVQGIFQDPYSSFNPFYRVNRLLDITFKRLVKVPSESKREKIVESALKTVGLSANEVLGRYPHELSGGQRQRLMLARGLIINPKVLIMDEPTSMIDASSRIGVLNLIRDLKKKGKSIIFITHDIGQAYYLSDTTVVMYKGEIAEKGPIEEVFFHSKHPYVKRLLADVPRLDKKWDL